MSLSELLELLCLVALNHSSIFAALSEPASAP